MVLVDYCKAFDMVDNGLFLDKLQVYAVVGKTMKWFQSYLADRHQLVYLGGSVSDMALMKHGVPIVYSAPCFSQILLTTCHFMSASRKSIFTQTILQSHRLQIVAAWEDCRNLLIHLYQKFLTGHQPTGFHSTKVNNTLEITCNGSLLANVMNVKLLGLEIDEELSFSEHITIVCKKVAQRIGLLKKIMNYLPFK